MLGVEDDGGLSGLKVTDPFLQSRGDLRSNGNIRPLPALSVAKFSYPAGDVAIVEVLPSDLPPVRYKGQVWIRVGLRKALANEQEERILSERRASYARSFDASPCPEAGIDDLALGLFDAYRREVIAPDVIQGNHRSIEEQLVSLRSLIHDAAAPRSQEYCFLEKIRDFICRGLTFSIFSCRVAN